MSETKEKEENEFEDIDFDLKDEKTTEETETEDKLNLESIEVFTEDERLTRDLIPKTLLYDYFKAKTQQLHGSRFSISKEAVKTLTQLTNEFVKSYLDQLCEYVIELVLMSRLKTAFPRHIKFSHKLISMVRSQTTIPSISKKGAKRLASEKTD